MEMGIEVWEGGGFGSAKALAVRQVLVTNEE